MMNNYRRTVLVIDDEDAVRQSIADYLEDLCYRVLTAENGRIGVDLFENQGADLVLVDLRMPEMDGLEVLAEITRTSPDTPLIVVSGTGVISDAVEALRQGAWDYLLKPIGDFSVLVHAVESALEKARLKLENRQYQRNLEQMVTMRTKELERATIGLRENEEQFRSILDNIQTGIVIVEVNTRQIVYVNPAAAGMADISTENIISGICTDLFCPTKKGECPVLDLGLEVKSSERMLKTREGRQIPILKTITRMVYRGRDCLLESFFDLTAQKTAESEKTALETQLVQAQKMEALGTLAGGIAHDFNNILSAIIGYTELCYLDAKDPDHPFHQKLKSMLHAGNRAKDLVGQILTFSRMKEHILTPVNVAPIIKEALKLLKASLPANIELKQSITSRQQIMADPTKIHQIIMNLCTNAYHAMEENGGQLTVSIKSVQLDEQACKLHGDLPPGGYLQLTVKDTGSGISPAVIDRIFDPYFTTKDKKGTGLGLSVVHGIVKSHGGAITVESQVGEGTDIRVYFPATDHSEAVNDEQPPVLARGTEKILLVDDEMDLVHIVCEMLEKLGYGVTGVVGSAQALETFRRSPEEFDLVITDLNMPVMNGDRLAQELTRIRPGLPIILCTGFSDPFNEQRAGSLGIRKLIKKPMAMNILAEAVRNVLDES
ncbi:MAG: response regulator [Deltaproteobacteria bacterium]|nr:response regulator [Deltaproteobacteria bacterium]